MTRIMQATSLRVDPTASPPRHRVNSGATGCNAIFVIFLCIVAFALILIQQSMTRPIFFPQSPLDGEDLQQPWSIKIANISKATNNLDGFTSNPMEMATLATPSTAGKAAPIPKNATTIAYAVSLVMCGNHNGDSAALIDSSLVLRHSIHNISVRNPDSGSKYDYKMYAIVHRQAEKCSEPLKRAGFEILVVPPPILTREIRGEIVRKGVHRAFCCGHHEFIKLYAYNKIPEEIFVHTDIDFAFLQPMDHLFDAMLHDKDSKEGKLARSKIERERDTDEWPEKIEAYITRDWHQVAPSKFNPGYQAGFMVGRRNPKVFDEVIEIIREGNYTEGYGMTAGWGGKGYGGYVGAMAMQGLMGYYYDHVRPNTAVELNQCRYNHMGLDVRYNAHPYFNKKWGRKGQCRNNNPEDICEDCMVTKADKIYNIHYTQCRKPWSCIAVGAKGGLKPGGVKQKDYAIDLNAVNLEHCMGLHQVWHSLRIDLENKLFDLTGDQSILTEGRNGTYRSEVFRGHCNDDGAHGYVRLAGKEESYARFHELYDP